MYDFSGSGSDVGAWRDASVGCGHSQCRQQSYSGGGCDPTDGGGGDCRNLNGGREKKVVPLVSTRMQNSIIAYDSYIIIYTFQYFLSRKDWAVYPGIFYMNVETEDWSNVNWQKTAEPSTAAHTYYNFYFSYH